MPGRGRPRKNKEPEETKQPTCPKKRDGILQQPQDAASKEQKPNEIKDKFKSADKPVQSSRKDEMIRQQKTNPGSKNSAVSRTKVSTPAERTKSTTTPEEMAKAPTKATTQVKDSPKNTRRKSSTKTRSDVDLTEERGSPPPEDTAVKSLKATKEKKCGGKVKQRMKLTGRTESDSQVQKKAGRLMSKVKPAAPDKPEMAPVKEEVFLDKTKLPKRFAGGAAETKKAANKEPPQGRMARGGQKKELDSILRKTLEKEKIRKPKQAEAATVVNNVVKTIMKHLKENSKPFKDAEQLNTGSYYEKLKISNPDEFDVMICVPVERVKVEPFEETGAFYSVSLKRVNSPLKAFQLEENGILSASQLLENFREEVKKSIKGTTEWKVERKKARCPAVTLITETPSSISMDVVLSLKVKSSWPALTMNGFKIEKWLGTKAKQEYKRNPYYLVPKYEGIGSATKDGIRAMDTWRLSFSNIEKAIMMNHGSEKTCCEARGVHCCRKDCLKLLKHILHLLKKDDPTLKQFCSYHAKTTLLHACCTRNRDSDWRDSELGACFKQLLEDFVGYLENGALYNFFIPTQNLLSGIGQKTLKSLASKIREEAANDFPLF